MKRALVTASLCLVAPAVHAQPATQCIESYEGAQELRAAGRLIEARTALGRCLETCTGSPRADCSAWLDDVERAIPTVVFDFVDAGGRSRPDVRVSAGGKLVAARLDGRAIALDPGAHTFVFELRGEPPVERRLTLLEGDKRRKIVASLPRRARAVVPVAPPPPEESWSAPHWATWALGGVALAGFGLFAGFGLHSLALEDCAPACTDAEVDRIVDERIAADVGLAVGASSLAAALAVGLATSAPRSENAPRGAMLLLTLVR